MSSSTPYDPYIPNQSTEDQSNSRTAAIQAVCIVFYHVLSQRDWSGDEMESIGNKSEVGNNWKEKKWNKSYRNEILFFICLSILYCYFWWIWSWRFMWAMSLEKACSLQNLQTTLWKRVELKVTIFRFGFVCFACFLMLNCSPLLAFSCSFLLLFTSTPPFSPSSLLLFIPVITNYSSKSMTLLELWEITSTRSLKEVRDWTWLKTKLTILP